MTRVVYLFSIIFLSLRAGCSSGNLNFYELENAFYDFNIDTKPEVMDEVPDDNDTMITVSNKFGQQFICHMPLPPEPKEKDLSSGTSVNPKVAANLVSSTLTKCIGLKNGWWTYTLCRGKSIIQSHGKEDDADYVKNSLGIFTGKYSMPTTMTQSTLEKMMYLEEKYDMGEICDVTGAPRSAVVRYECYPNFRDTDAMITSVDEEASCEYAISVKVGSLCVLSQFAPPVEPSTQPIRCSPLISSNSAERLKKNEEKRKQNKIDAVRALGAISIESEQAKIRRWSIQRRHLLHDEEKYNLKMAQLDDEYIDLTRDHLELQIVSRTGDEPNEDTMAVIQEIVDNMESIDTAKVVYDSIADEDRANLWYYFNNPKWREDGFPLLLDEVDFINGFSHFIRDWSAEVTKKQYDRLTNFVLYSHLSRLEAIIAYFGRDEFKEELQSLILNLSGNKEFMRMNIEEFEKEYHKILRGRVAQSTQSTILKLVALFWAQEKIHDIDPLREDYRIPSDINSFAEVVDRLMHTMKLTELERSIEKKTREIKDDKKELILSFEENKAKNSDGDYMSFYELSERDRDMKERSMTIDRYTKFIEEYGMNEIKKFATKQFPVMKAERIRRSRDTLPSDPLQKYELDGAAMAVFRDTLNARELLEKLLQTGLMEDQFEDKSKLKVQVYVKGGQTLSAEDDKLINELIKREMKEAREREKLKQREKAYEYVFREDDLE